jgi:hypothetical protein
LWLPKGQAGLWLDDVYPRVQSAITTSLCAI